MSLPLRRDVVERSFLDHVASLPNEERRDPGLTVAAWIHHWRQQCL